MGMQHSKYGHATLTSGQPSSCPSNNGSSGPLKDKNVRLVPCNGDESAFKKQRIRKSIPDTKCGPNNVSINGLRHPQELINQTRNHSNDGSGFSNFTYVYRQRKISKTYSIRIYNIETEKKKNRVIAKPEPAPYP